MKPIVKLASLLIVTLCGAITFPRPASAQTSTPNAYVYIINGFFNPPITIVIDGFSADSTGALTKLPGSPFWTSHTDSQFWTLTHSANWLFASDGANIYSFSIASNGALTLKSSINAQQFSPGGADVITALFLDRTWSTLYATEVADSGGTSGNAILAFKKNGTTGALTYLGSTDYPSSNTFPLNANSLPLAFLGNNQYAYNASCINGNVSWFAGHRNSDGTLDRFSINPPLPSNPNGSYCPQGVAADLANNLAVALPPQLAVYTADSSGNLTTNSTAANMPFGGSGRMSVSPAGNLLAVCGGGVQVFHFNGSNPITPYTKKLSLGCDGLAWDKHNHLYAIESARVKEWRITPSFWTAAPPYYINAPFALTVLSK